MTSTADCPEILIVAAEASSALYAQRLLEHWQSRDLKFRAFGIGSQAMEQLGFERLGRSEELAVVGLTEVISHWGQIKSAFHALVDAAKTRKPKVALLLDYPDFNLRLAKQLKKQGVKVVYYISPQVWAWRTSRVKTIKKWIDKMLVLFPFEVNFYRQHEVDVEFVGHPLLDELNPELMQKDWQDYQRSRYGIKSGEVLLALMPGSRKSELNHHLEDQIRAAEEMTRTRPNLRVALLVAPTFSTEELRSRLPRTSLPLILMKEDPFKMIAMADVVLCASGTATLMVGLLAKPMVIMYRMNPVTAFLAKRFVKATRFFGLINLVMDQLVVPELFQDQAKISDLVRELAPLVDQSELRSEKQKSLLDSRNRLGSSGATLRVAKVVEGLW